MAMQRVRHFRDIRYTHDVRYGELFMQNEIEMSRYNMDEANIDDLRQRFALFEAVRARAAAQGLIALCGIAAAAHLASLHFVEQSSAAAKLASRLPADATATTTNTLTACRSVSIRKAWTH